MKTCYTTECIPQSCMPGWLSLTNGSNSFCQIYHPSLLWVNVPYHAFTNNAIKKTEFLTHPITELMGLINQLFGVTYISEPTMLYWLVSMAIDQPLDVLTNVDLLRPLLKDIEKLRHIFFCERWKFIQFTKAKTPMLHEMELDDALLLMQQYFQCDTVGKKKQRFNKEDVARFDQFVRDNKAMGSSGFIIQVQHCTTKLGPNGKTIPDVLLGIQYQVVKVQKSENLKTKQREIEIYFCGSPGDHSCHVAVSRFNGKNQGGVKGLLTKCIPQIQGEDTEYFATFWGVKFDPRETN